MCEKGDLHERGDAAVEREGLAVRVGDEDALQRGPGLAQGTLAVGMVGVGVPDLRRGDEGGDAAGGEDEPGGGVAAVDEDLLTNT